MEQGTKTATFSHALIWFGAAVSIAEILTGTLIAPLGFSKGILAILVGHLIGCIPLFFAGLIGAKSGKNAMETVKFSFGSKGGHFFSVVNVLQLVGWTAVMIIGGARATGVILNPLLNTKGEALWCVVIGGLIIVWILIGIKNLRKINVFAMGMLFILTIVLSRTVFSGSANIISSQSMSFGMAVELSAAMPLSWLPLISDYTKDAKRPKTATAVSVIVYFFTSCWMYMIGLGAAIFTTQSDIGLIMLEAGLGMVGVLIIIFSTVTTTFLDAYSAGVSFLSLTKKISEKWSAMIVCLLGVLLAIFTPIEQYENFLYLISSVFAPMIAILITDFFILKNNYIEESINITNSILWAAGFVIYRYFMTVDTIIGNTLPVMLIVGILVILINGGKNLCLKKY